MNLRTKKNIAKEILYFISGIILVLIFWAFIEIQNYYYQNKIITYNKEITQLKFQINKIENQNDLLIIPSRRNVFHKNIEEMKRNNSSEVEINSMINEFKKIFSIENKLKEYIKTANNPEYKSDFKVINSKFPELQNYDKNILEEYVATANNPKYNGNFKVINSKFPELFPEQIKIDKLKKNEIIEANKIKNINLKILTRNDIVHNVKILSIVLLGLIYLVRIIFISVKWAIKTLKIKN